MTARGFDGDWNPRILRICVCYELFERVHPGLKSTLVRTGGNSGRGASEFPEARLPAVMLPEAHQILESALVGDVAFARDFQARGYEGFIPGAESQRRSCRIVVSRFSIQPEGDDIRCLRDQPLAGCRRLIPHSKLVRAHAQGGISNRSRCFQNSAAAQAIFHQRAE
jgi:hypothetical protein